MIDESPYGSSVASILRKALSGLWGGKMAANKADALQLESVAKKFGLAKSLFSL